MGILYIYDSVYSYDIGFGNIWLLFCYSVYSLFGLQHSNFIGFGTVWIIMERVPVYLVIVGYSVYSLFRVAT